MILMLGLRSNGRSWVRPLEAIWFFHRFCRVASFEDFDHCELGLNRERIWLRWPIILFGAGQLFMVVDNTRDVV